jgi:hypothetical protein
VLLDCSQFVAAAKGKAVFVSVLPMPFSTTQQRLALRNELLLAYNPVCQTDAGRTPSRDLEFKLAELEKKHQEQTAQMMQLMASMNPALDPARARRQRIGFVPSVEPATD